MTTTGELIDKIRKNWKAELNDEDEFAWRREIKAVDDIEHARQALSNLYRARPHHRPTLEQFRQEAHDIANPHRVSPDQIARNLAGLQAMRSAWANRHQTQETTQ